MIYSVGIPMGEERTAKFGEDIIKFCKSLKLDTISAGFYEKGVEGVIKLDAIY